jgi:hypothetical protein
MNNKLEEYKEAFSENFEDRSSVQYNTGRRDGRKEGFDAALALNLPILYKKWYVGEILKCQESISYSDKVKPYAGLDDKELYQYWRDNIYKPE